MEPVVPHLDPAADRRSSAPAAAPVRYGRRLTTRSGPDETTLLRLAAGGDADAFAQLYLQHHDDLLRYAARRARPGVDPADAVHDAVIATWAALSRGAGPKDGFRPYVFTAVRRCLVRRNLAAGREVARQLDDVAVPEVPDLVEISEAVERLPARWQLVLQLAVVDGLRVADLAPVLGLEPNAVSALLHRARVGLRVEYRAGMAL